VTTPRYRCAACGNLTRFDVTTTRTMRAYHHFTVGGELVVEEEETLADSTDDVSCRWCGHGRSVEVVTEPADAAAASPAGASHGDPGQR
jgi:hypothetical protein